MHTSDHSESSGSSGGRHPEGLPAPEHLLALLDALRDPAFIKDRSLRYVYINPAGAATWGKRPADVLGLTDFDLFAPASAERIAAVDKRILEFGTHMELEENAAGKQGDARVYSSIKGPVRDGNGQIVGVFGVARDLTEARRLGESLKERVKEKRALYEVIRCLSRVDIPFQDCLEQVVRCLPPGWQFPTRTAARITFDGRTHTVNAFDERQWILTSPIRRFDTVAGSVEVSVALDPDENSATPFLPEEQELLDCVAGAIGEASERRRLEEQFFQSQKMESIGRLAGGVAHDFNNILGVILGHAELLMESIPPTTVEFDDLKQIHDAAQRAAGLTRQLLAFSRQEAAQPALLNLNDCIDGMIRMLGRLVGEEIELVWRPGADTMLVRVDPVQCQQVIANLAVNARDAIAGPGKIIIETSFRNLDTTYCVKNVEFQPGDYVLLNVSDTGSGIPKETLPLIFEPFFTTKAPGKGTGLGLATVYGIVKQNGGFIQVYSEVGRGTTFGVYLPRRSGATAPPQHAPADRPSARTSETILLVEDDSQLLELHTKSIATMGYQVLAAESPEQALRMIAAHAGPIHLMVTDIVMPGMNGFDLYAAVAAARPTMRCLFTSGYTADVIADRGIHTDRVHFIQKPFSRQSLAQKMRECLESPLYGEGGETDTTPPP